VFGCRCEVECTGPSPPPLPQDAGRSRPSLPPLVVPAITRRPLTHSGCPPPYCGHRVSPIPRRPTPFAVARRIFRSLFGLLGRVSEIPDYWRRSSCLVTVWTLRCSPRLDPPSPSCPRPCPHARALAACWVYLARDVASSITLCICACVCPGISAGRTVPHAVPDSKCGIAYVARRTRIRDPQAAPVVRLVSLSRRGFGLLGRRDALPLVCRVGIHARSTGIRGLQLPLPHCSPHRLLHIHRLQNSKRACTYFNNLLTSLQRYIKHQLITHT